PRRASQVEGGRGRANPGESRRELQEAESSSLRSAPSTGVLGSNGIPRRGPRMNKDERGHRLRGPGKVTSRGGGMRFAGIDIASETHMLAVAGENSEVLLKATPFTEDAEGYRRVRELLGEAKDCLVAMEATGHYWQNLFAFLAAEGFAIALLN